MSSSLIIFLHGVGARGADLAPLGASWRAALPDTAFAVPDAPFAFDQGGAGRQWFSVSGVTEANRPARIADARAAFDTTIAALLAEHGLTARPERVAFVGFSQGAIMALDAVASGRWPVAAVVAFAGRLASPPPLAPATATPVLLLHGSADRVTPASESEAAERQLRALGVPVTREVLPGVGHAITPQGAAAAAAFLERPFVVDA